MEARHTFASIQEEIENMLDIPDNELTPEQREALDVYLNELADMEAEKVDSFAGFMRAQADMAKACRAESRRLEEKARTCEKNMENLRNRYLGIMTNHGLKKVKGNAYTLSVRESVAVSAPEDQETLQAMFEANPLFVTRKVTYAPDKKIIKESLSAGIPVEGCELVRNQSLQIR